MSRLKNRQINLRRTTMAQIYVFAQSHQGRCFSLNEWSRNVRKHTFWYVHQTKTQIRPLIRVFVVYTITKTCLYNFDHHEHHFYMVKKVREKSRECHNHKTQPFPDPKRKRKPTNLNKHKPNKRTKSSKISSLFPKWGNRNTKRTEKHKNKMTHGKTYNKSPRRINYKATKNKTNTGTTALERSVEQTTGGFKALLQLANFTLGPYAKTWVYRGIYYFSYFYWKTYIVVLVRTTSSRRF